LRKIAGAAADCAHLSFAAAINPNDGADGIAIVFGAAKTKADGVAEFPGIGTFEGHDALREAYAGWKPVRPQRHLVLNTLVTDWNDHEAKAISDVVFVLKGESGWAIQLVSRYHDTLHHDDGTWKFHHRTAEFVT